MIDQIMQEIRYIRSRLDAHMDGEDQTLSDIRRDISKIREDMASHKTIIGIASSALAAIIAVIVSWTTAHWSK